MSDFLIKVEKRDKGITIIRVMGYLDAYTFESLEKTLQELFEEGRYKLVVDLDRLEYISSAGAGVFIGALGEVQEKGGNIVILNVTDSVNQVFETLGFHQVFLFPKDLEEAIGYYR